MSRRSCQDEELAPRNDISGAAASPTASVDSWTAVTDPVDHQQQQQPPANEMQPPSTSGGEEKHQQPQPQPIHLNYRLQTPFNASVFPGLAMGLDRHALESMQQQVQEAAKFFRESREAAMAQTVDAAGGDQPDAATSVSVDDVASSAAAPAVEHPAAEVDLDGLFLKQTKKLHSVALLSGLQSSADVHTKLEWMMKTIVQPHDASHSSADSEQHDFGFFHQGSSICGELMKMAAIVFSLPRERKTSREAVDQFHSVVNVILKQMNLQTKGGPFLSHDEMTAVLNDILISRGTYSSESNTLMHRLIESCLHGNTSSKDCTPAVIYLCENGFIELTSQILSQQEPFRRYGCVTNPFKKNQAGRTLSEVLMRRVEGQKKTFAVKSSSAAGSGNPAAKQDASPPPLHTNICLALLSEMEEFIVGTLQDVLTRSLGITLKSLSDADADDDDSADSAAVGEEILTYFDCYGRATEKLKMQMAEKLLQSNVATFPSSSHL
jgi:hypothetical protein